MTRDEIIARIYEAALVPECWPDLLHVVAQQIGARGGLVFYYGDAGMQFIASPGLVPLMEGWVANGWHLDPRRSAPLLKSQHPGFLSDLDLFTEEERRTLPFYTEFLTPNHCDLGAGTVVSGASGNRLVVTFEGFGDVATLHAATPVLDDLRPHIARAAVLSAEVRLRQNGATVSLLNQLGNAAAILGRRGDVVTANGGFTAMLGSAFLERRDRLRLADRASDQLFAQALTRLASEGCGASIPLRDGDGVGTAALHLVPVRHRAHDIFSEAHTIALVARASTSTAPDPALLQALFDLTPMEAAVARSVATGEALEAIARTTGKSVETVRSHLKRVFSKTATRRQNELAVLLRGLVLPTEPARA